MRISTWAASGLAALAAHGARTATLASAQFSDCQIIQEVELVGQRFPVKMDPNSLTGNSDPNNPSGAVQPSTPPPNTGYEYIWPGVATADPT